MLINVWTECYYTSIAKYGFRTNGRWLNVPKMRLSIWRIFSAIIANIFSHRFGSVADVRTFPATSQPPSSNAHTVNYICRYIYSFKCAQCCWLQQPFSQPEPDRNRFDFRMCGSLFMFRWRQQPKTGINQPLCSLALDFSAARTSNSCTRSEAALRSAYYLTPYAVHTMAHHIRCHFVCRMQIHNIYTTNEQQLSLYCYTAIIYIS